MKIWTLLILAILALLAYAIYTDQITIVVTVQQPTQQPAQVIQPPTPAPLPIYQPPVYEPPAWQPQPTPWVIVVTPTYDPRYNGFTAPITPDAIRPWPTPAPVGDVYGPPAPVIPYP